jgi:hypothetical protein
MACHKGRGSNGKGLIRKGWHSAIWGAVSKVVKKEGASGTTMPLLNIV